MGVIPIICKKDFFSCDPINSNLLVRKLTRLIKVINAENANIFVSACSEKPYKLDSFRNKYGDCSLTVERVVVVRKTRVRLPSFTLWRKRE